jgi:hypothetical protein
MRHNKDIQVAAIGGAYGADRYHDDVPRPRSRCGNGAGNGGTIASPFAYRDLSSGFPALPIIKVSIGPNTVDYDNSEGARSNPRLTSITSPGSSETLFAREQQPINIREAPRTVPRVISSIPVSSRPTDPPLSTAPGSAAGALLALAPADTAPALDAPIASAIDSDVARRASSGAYTVQLASERSAGEVARAVSARSPVHGIDQSH